MLKKSSEKSPSRIGEEIEKSPENCSKTGREVWFKTVREMPGNLKKKCDAVRRISLKKTIAAKTIENQQHFLLQAESPEKALSQIDSATENVITKSFTFFIR